MDLRERTPATNPGKQSVRSSCKDPIPYVSTHCCVCVSLPKGFPELAGMSSASCPATKCIWCLFSGTCLTKPITYNKNHCSAPLLPSSHLCCSRWCNELRNMPQKGNKAMLFIQDRNSSMFTIISAGTM